MTQTINPYKEPLICEDPVFKEDTNCCAVVAFTKVFDTGYTKAYNFIKKVCGRTHRKGLTQSQVLSIFENVKKGKWKMGKYSKNNRITINQFIKKHPKGRFYCLVRGHAIAIIDGVLYDYKEGGRRQITKAFRVYLEGEL
jgi:hypothetical protein